jgi:hypothetical protein
MALAQTLFNSTGGYESAVGFGTGAFTTPSFTSLSSSLVVVAVGVSQESGATDPSGDMTCKFTGAAAMDKRIAVGNASSWSCGVAIFTFEEATGQARTLEVDLAARNAYVYFVQAYSFTGYNTSTPTGFTASNGNFGTNGAVALTLSGTPAADSTVIGAIFGDASSGGTLGASAGTDFTEAFDNTSSDQFNFLESMYNAAPTGTSVPWADICTGTGTLAKSVAVALEIKAAAEAGGVTLKLLSLLGAGN